MGRGRAKAKQTKVARQLKYNSGGTDLERLRAELASAGSDGAGSALDGTPAVDSDATEDDDYVDPYAEDEDDD